MKSMVWLLALLPITLNAKVLLLESTNHYIVKENNKNILLQSVREASPIRQHGKVFFGQANYDIRWRFWWKSTGKQCRMTKVQTTLKLNYMLPKLITDDLSITEAWMSWMPKLKVHEKRHGKLAISTAKEIDRQLSGMTPRKNCKILESDANELGNKLMKQLTKANRDYDKKTNHGETENAWLSQHL